MANIRIKKEKDDFEVLVNGGLSVYRNVELDKALAWIKLHYKVGDDMLLTIKDSFLKE